MLFLELWNSIFLFILFEFNCACLFESDCEAFSTHRTNYTDRKMNVRRKVRAELVRLRLRDSDEGARERKRKKIKDTEILLSMFVTL